MVSHQYGFAGEYLDDLGERRSCRRCHEDILYEDFWLVEGDHPRIEFPIISKYDLVLV